MHYNAEDKTPVFLFNLCQNPFNSAIFEKEKKIMQLNPNWVSLGQDTVLVLYTITQ